MPLSTYASDTQPKYSASDFQLPDWYEKSARQTKNTYLTNQIGERMADYGNEAYRLRDEEERRGAAQEQYLRDASARANVPTITDEEINRQFGRKSDLASQSFLNNMAGLREYAGESGVGGGVVQGLAANYELGRLASLTNARGDLMSFKATQDALDRQRAFDRSMVVGQSINRPVSMLGVDYQNQALQTQKELLGIETNRAGAKYAAEASKSAANLGLAGSVLGSGMGLVGSLL